MRKSGHYVREMLESFAVGCVLCTLHNFIINHFFTVFLEAKEGRGCIKGTYFLTSLKFR